MGRFAAVVWGAAGAYVLVAALVTLPEHLGTLVRGYGGSDSATILFGCVNASLAGVGAFWGATRWWNAHGPHWPVVPAMVLMSGSIMTGVMMERIDYAFFWVPMLASLFGIWFLLPAIFVGGIATAAVSGLDALYEWIARR